MTLKVYADRMSQPSRAVLIFCKVNGIEFEEIKIHISKKQQRSPEYREINPMRNVPAIVDGRFKLFESHAILVYLACAFPGVADHWYPADLFARAKINSVMHWHHSNLRQGSAPLVFNRKLAPIFGLPLNAQAAAQAEKVLLDSLEKIESVWLKGKGRFLFGSSQPSIADLSLVCEIMQLELLDQNERNRILGPHKRVLQWVEDTKNATRPHFDEMHNIIFMFKEKMAKMSTEGENIKTVAGNKEMLSKMCPAVPFKERRLTRCCIDVIPNPNYIVVCRKLQFIDTKNATKASFDLSTICSFWSKSIHKIAEGVSSKSLAGNSNELISMHTEGQPDHMFKVSPDQIVKRIPSRDIKSTRDSLYTIWMKSLLFNGCGCTIFSSDGEIVYRIDNYNQKWKDQVYLMDLHGKVLVSLGRKKLRVFEQWDGFKWSSCGGIMRQKPWFQVKKDCNILKRSMTNCHVILGCDHKACYKIIGFPEKSEFRIIRGENQLVAEVKRKQTATGVILGEDVLSLKVVEGLPQKDHLLIIALVIVYGLINNKL